MQSTGRSCRQPQGGTRWTVAVWEQLSIRRETLAAARLVRRDFGLSDVRDIDSLIELVSRRRGKTIKVLRVALPSRVSAFCVATPNLDFIVVDAHASELTQLHAIAHELGHFLFDGTEEDTDDLDVDEPLPRELAQQLVPALNPDAVSRFFKRSHYNSKKERRVEAFATVMLERNIALRPTIAGGLESTFTHRRTGV